MDKEILKIARMAVFDCYDKFCDDSPVDFDTVVEHLDKSINKLGPVEYYYDVGDLDTWDVIDAKCGFSGVNAWLHGNILKYACRMPYKHKEPTKDLHKLIDNALLLYKNLTGKDFKSDYV